MIRVLLIEHDSTDAEFISDLYKGSATLAGNYQVTGAVDPATATDLLQTKTFDVIILSTRLTDKQSLAVIETLRQVAERLPIIVLGDSAHTRLLRAALKRGVQDYLVKGHIDSEVLQRATQYAIERQKAQNFMQRAQKINDEMQQEAVAFARERRQLIELNRAKDEFISLSSHQLRTPATSVKQYLGMIIEGFAGDVPEHLEVFLRTAYNSNERQLTIISDLIKTAQVDSDKYVLQKQTVNLCELVQAAIDDYGTIVQLRKQTVEFDGSCECLAPVDPNELRLVIANLLENASKYSPEHTTITLKLKTYKTYVKLTVTDEGVGIAPDQTRKIFDKFIRFDNELSDTVSGSGLGLYFVQRIIRLHGGQIRVRSQLGAGSEFIVTLPL